ncbi:MAG: HEAT repeat domain-containing protein, partial [Planctomycetota bacterium]
MRRLLLVLTLACSVAAQDEIAQLRDPDPNVRRRAAERLGEQRTAAAVPVLIDAAYDPSAYVSAAAVDALGRIGPAAREAVPWLEELALAHTGFHDRVQRAVGAIGRSPPKVPALIVWLRKNGMQAETLEGIRKELVDAVLPALSHKNARVRGQAALVLGRCAPAEPRVVAALFAARAHESPYVRGQVFRALVKDGATAAQAFAKELEHDDVSVRRVAALALKRMGRHARVAMPALIRAVKDEDIHVRSDAIRAIGSQRAAPKEAVIALTEVLEETDERLRRTVIYACSFLGRDAAPATLALAVLLEADDPDLRTRVCSVLANIGPDAAIATPALIQACYDETWEVASAALRALGRIGPGAAAAAPYVAEFAECYPFATGVAPPVLRALGAGEPLPLAPKAEELPLLLSRLADGDPEGAGKAAFLIGRLAPQDAATRAALRAALRHRTPYVRRHASFALRRIGPASAPVLVEALEQGGTVERRLAADTLFQLAREVDATAQRALQRALSDPDIYVRRQACSAIGVIG